MDVRRAGPIFAAICLVPTAAAAQRGGMVSNRMGDVARLTRAPAIEIPKYVNPVNLLIQHRQDLTLTDTQFVRIIGIKRTTDSTNAPLVRRLDSVQVLFKGAGPLFGAQTAERRDSLASARAVIRETLVLVRENVSTARDGAYALLSPAQRVKAQEFEDKAARAIDEENGAKTKGREGGGSKPPV